MRVGQSYTVEVFLIPKTTSSISTLQIENATGTISHAETAGTPGTTLRQAFGAGFEAPLGEATLTSDTFSISPSGPEKQPLDQSRVTWDWSITPQQAGTQYLSVVIVATWSTVKGEERGPYRIGSKTFQADVTKPFFVLGQIDVGSVLTSLPSILLGAGGLGALFILWLVSRAYQKRKRTNTLNNHTIVFGASSQNKPKSTGQKPQHRKRKH